MRHHHWHHHRPAAAGVVEGAPSGESFTIKTHGGATDTVDVSSTTTYSEWGVSNPTLSNVESGDHVVVFGTVSGSTVTATHVLILPPPPLPPSLAELAAAGVVEGAPSGESFTIKTHGGATDTVDVSSTTTYSEWGVSNPTLSNVESGDHVVVFGTVSGSTVTATHVLILPPPPLPPSLAELAAAGVVEGAPSGESFTIKTHGGATDTVDVSSTTTYSEWGVSNPTLSNVESGDHVVVFGTVSGSTVTATYVLILGSGEGWWSGSH